jgi:anti-sigma factor RsiW
MKCSEFLARFSEYYDGGDSAGGASDLEAHLASCPRCQQYRWTVEEGIRLARELPSIDVPRDFRARLTHRIYHVEDGEAIARERLGSGTTTLAILAVAAFIALAAWTPLLDHRTSVELPALVVSAPPGSSVAPAPAPPTFSRSLSAFTSSEFQEGIWGDPHQLLFRYSTVSERRVGPFWARTGLQ